MTQGTHSDASAKFTAEPVFSRLSWGSREALANPSLGLLILRHLLEELSVCSARHNLLAVQEENPKILKDLGLQ